MNYPRRAFDKYVTATKILDRGLQEIFENPSSKEIGSLGDKEFRYIADSQTKKVYVFSINMLHLEALQALNIPISKGQSRLYGGIALIKGGVAQDVGVSFDIGVTLNAKAIMEKDWSWADRYVRGISEAVKNFRGPKSLMDL